MDDDLNARLWGEVIALRVIVGRLLGITIPDRMTDEEGFSGHLKMCQAALALQDISDVVPGRADKIRAYAEGVIDNLCTPNTLPSD